MSDSIQDLGENLIYSVTETDHWDEFLSWTQHPEFDSDTIENLAETVPFIRSFIYVYKTGISIREKFFLKKLGRFLTDLPDVTEKERVKMQRKLESNPDERKRIGEFLVVILERFNDVGKAKILATLFSAYLSEKINQVTFIRMANAIDNCMVSDLRVLREFESSQDHHPMATASMYSSGLLELKPVLDMEFDGALNHFGISSFGRHFLEIAEL